MRQTVWLTMIVGGLLAPTPLLEPARGQFPGIRPQRSDPPVQAPQRRYADVPFRGNLEMTLKSRLEQIRDLSDLIEQLQKHPEFLDQKLKGGNWKDPKFLEKEGPKLLEMFKKMGFVQKEGEGLKLNAEKLNGLKADLKKQIGAFQGDGNPIQLPDKNPFAPDPNAPPPFQGQPPDFTPNEPAGLPLLGGVDEPDKLTDFFKDWMHNLEDSKFGDLFKNSPSFQEGLKDLAQAFQKGEGSMWKPGSGFANTLAKWGNPGDLTWFKNSWSKFNNLSMPSVRPPGWAGPKFGGWAAHLPTPAPGVWGGPAAAGGIGFGLAFLWVGVGLVVLILLWKFLPQLKLAARARQSQGWQLGPWPVDPHTVATRAEVVRAFEFLSLLRFGLDVRTWNHRDIAAALGSEAGVRRAAEELAGVYELARYTPNDERLPEASLAAARRDLCLLAGLS